MMITRRYLCLAIVLLTAFVDAQKHPDFSGTWVLDSSRTINMISGQPLEAPKAAAGIAKPGEVTVTQTPSEIKIVRTSSVGSTTYVFALDGRPSTNHNGAEVMQSRSRWEGTRLVTDSQRTSVTSAGERTWDYKEVRYLDARGTMIVEGTSSTDGKVTFASRLFFTRKKQP